MYPKLTLLSCLILLQSAWAAEYEPEFIRAEILRAEEAPDSSTAIQIDLPIESVFDALLTRLAEYTEDVSSIRFDHFGSSTPGELGVGSERITTMTNGDTLVQRIMVYQPPEEFAYFTDMTLSTVDVPIEYSVGHYRFRELADGRIEARVSVVFEPSSRLTAFLVRIGFSRALSRDFENAESYLNSLDNE